MQRSFDGPTKAEDVRDVPILDPLLPVLREWRLNVGGRLVFTSSSTRSLHADDDAFGEEGPAGADSRSARGETASQTVA